MSIEDRWVSTATCMWPKKAGKYLITVKDRFAESGYSVVAVTFEPEYEENERWYNVFENELDEIDYMSFLPKNVTAWMPYPKPYKKGG